MKKPKAYVLFLALAASPLPADQGIVHALSNTGASAVHDASTRSVSISQTRPMADAIAGAAQTSTTNGADVELSRFVGLRLAIQANHGITLSSGLGFGYSAGWFRNPLVGTNKRCTLSFSGNPFHQPTYPGSYETSVYYTLPPLSAVQSSLSAGAAIEIRGEISVDGSNRVNIPIAVNVTSLDPRNPHAVFTYRTNAPGNPQIAGRYPTREEGDLTCWNNNHSRMDLSDLRAALSHPVAPNGGVISVDFRGLQ